MTARMTKASLLGFTGAYQDPVSCAYPLGNGYRWYSPTLMRFTAADDLSPFGAGGVNPYTYCGGDPINRADPTGHFFFDEAAIERTMSEAESTAGRLAVDASTGASTSRSIGAVKAQPAVRHSFGKEAFAPHYRISLSEGKPLFGYSSMTLTGYSVNEGEFTPLQSALSLRPGETITTPPIHIADLEYSHGRPYAGDVDLHFNLEPLAGSGVRPVQTRLRVSAYAQDLNRWYGSEDWPRPPEWHAGLKAGYPTALPDASGSVRPIQTAWPHRTELYDKTGIMIPKNTIFNLAAQESPEIPFTITGVLPHLNTENVHRLVLIRHLT